MTPEQQKLQADLIAEYGETVVRQAQELSGLSMCMVALGAEDLKPAERARAYQQASLHLGQLLETMMSVEMSAKVTQCAKRMDSALDVWMADEIERRDGLPRL